jgi:hypothetical protein
MIEPIKQLRAFLLSAFTDYEVIQGQDNQVSMPLSDKFIVITPLSKTAPALGLASEFVDGLFIGSIAAGVIHIDNILKPFVLENNMNLWWSGQAAPVKVLNAIALTTIPVVTLTQTTIAVGKKSISQVFIGEYQIDFYSNDAYSVCEQFRNYFNDDTFQESFSDDVYPIKCSDATQLPFITGENQLLKRWKVNATIQHISTTNILTQQFFDSLEATL